jgi:hypothetical protein
LEIPPISGLGSKIKEKERKGEVITPMIYTRIFGVHKYELGSKCVA